MIKQGVLLINLGTPATCDTHSVRRYLKQFLNDPRVIDLPLWLRWPLVNGCIVPFRYKRIKAAYEKIWLNTGSPLFVLSEQLKEKLARALGADYQVELGMRYGEPSLFSVLKQYQSNTNLIVIPLFPQYASASTGSALEVVLHHIAQQWNVPALRVVRDFYQHPAFIAAYAEQIKQALLGKEIEMLIFSYHGLPKRHIDKSQCQISCDHQQACPEVGANNAYCYRAQCYATTRLIMQALGPVSYAYQVSFQSRLGRTPWIQPYTDLLLPALKQKGIKKIAMVCPSFVVDCLETLEEVDIRLRQQWMALGGSEFNFIPCVNDAPLMVQALVEMVHGSFM